MTGVRRLLALLSVAMVVDTAAYATISPLLPGLVGEHDLSKASAGLLTGSYPAGTLAASLPAAWVAARFGAKQTVIAALGVLAVASLVFAVAATPALLVIARTLQGIGAAAIWAGALAWVVAVAPRERRAEAIGTAVGAAIAGALGGPVLGAAAEELGTVVVFGAFVALPLGLIAVLAREPGPPAATGQVGAAVRAAAVEPLMRRGIWLMALPSLAFGTMYVLVPLQFDAFGAGAVTIGAVFLAAIALEAAVSPVAGRVSDRRGPVWPARLGLAAGGAVLALLPLPQAALPLALGVVVVAPLLGMLWTPAMALLSEGAERRGVDPAYGFGLANLGWGAGAALGGTGGAALAALTTDTLPYLVLAAAGLLTAALLREIPAVAQRSAAGQAIR